MKLFSTHFRLNKSQAELDFVDIPIEKDLPLFIDPFALSLRQERWSQRAHVTLISFFEKIIEVIRNGDLETAISKQAAGSSNISKSQMRQGSGYLKEDQGGEV
jgi:hypothetical protein